MLRSGPDWGGCRDGADARRLTTADRPAGELSGEQPAGGGGGSGDGVSAPFAEQLKHESGEGFGQDDGLLAEPQDDLSLGRFDLTVGQPADY